jgi:phosphatidylserine/phosphatidylglycerophosphate/cardiolipin synthase-like enzyme
LTREKSLPDHVSVFNAMYESLTADARSNLALRELYKTDTDGQHVHATHAKLIIADETTAYVGSANFTRTSLRYNFELGVLISGPAVREITQMFDYIFGNATPIELPIA